MLNNRARTVQAPQICSNKLVWGWRSRSKEGTLPYSFLRRRQLPQRNPRRYLRQEPG